jgi:type I restriction enzyme S subunit
MFEFNEVFIDSTKYVRKIKKSDYLNKGKHPIIDQGQEFVVGFTNDENGIYNGVPAIIFGDHTRIIKYIDKPFFIGADGVKVLKSKIDDIEYKYLYYALRSINIANTGYNRHFKWLKESKFSLPNRGAQKEIVSILDGIENLINLKNQELSQYDYLIKSRFVDMFGEVELNTKNYDLVKFGDVFELNAGGTPSKTKPHYWENGTISWIGSNLCQNSIIYENDGKYITEEGFKNSSARLFPIDTVLVALVGATIGKTALLKFETATNQNVLGIRGIKEAGFNPYFVYYYTQGLYNKFLNIGDGGFSMASKKFISELDIARVNILKQNEFSDFVKQVHKLKISIQKSLKETQILFDSLMQKYFG